MRPREYANEWMATLPSSRRCVSGGSVPHLVAALVEHAAIGPNQELAVLVDVGELDQVRMEAVFLAERLDRGLEGTEPGREPHLLLVGEGLVAEDEEGMLVERFPDVRPRAFVQRLAQGHAADLDAELGVQPRHAEGAGRGRDRILLNDRAR